MYFFSYYEAPIGEALAAKNTFCHIRSAFDIRHPVLVMRTWQQKYPGTQYNLISWQQLSKEEWDVIRLQCPYSVNL